MATKVTSGLISADAALVDLNIDASTLYVDASANRVGMGTTAPSTALHVKGDEVTVEDPQGGYKLHLNADSNPVVITANDNTGANYCGFRLKTNNGGAYPVTAMDVYPHGGASVAFGAAARTDTQMLISRAPTSATQTTPETILTLSNPCTSTSTDIKVGQGPRLVFEIPDDQSGNKATGAAIAALKEIDSDTNSQTTLAFYTSDDDETLDQRMTILSDGKVGIGTTSPSHTLTVNSGSGAVSAKLITTGASGYLQLDNSGGSSGILSNGDDLAIFTTSSGTERLRIGDNGFIKLPSKVSFSGTGDAGFGHHTNNYLYAYGGTAGLILQDNSAGSNRMLIRDSGTVEFEVNGAERARITSSGVLALGKTSDDSTSEGVWIRKHPSSGHGQIMCTGTSSSAYEGLYVYDITNSELEFYASYHGTIAYRATYNMSDERKKDNIQDITLGLDAVKELRPVSFDWKNDKGKDVLGFIAQEVETTSLKQLVGNYKDDNIDDLRSLNKEGLIPVLVKAVQELSAKLDAAEARIATLEG